MFDQWSLQYKLDVIEYADKAFMIELHLIESGFNSIEYGLPVNESREGSLTIGVDKPNVGRQCLVFRKPRPAIKQERLECAIQSMVSGLRGPVFGKQCLDLGLRCATFRRKALPFGETPLAVAYLGVYRPSAGLFDPIGSVNHDGKSPNPV